MALKYLYVPSGVNTGKAYGVLPNSADADFDDFARSSAGSRVDKNGLIDIGLGLGSEQVVDGDFDNPSSWVTNNATISNGRAIFIDGTGAYASIEQAGVLVVNKEYEVTIDVVINSGGGFKIQDAGGNVYKQITESGIHTFRFASIYSGTSLFIARNLVGVPYDMYIESVSVKEITEVNTDLPRLDYTGGGCPSLLLEDESTNYLQYSEDFVQSYWNKTNASISNYNEVSPEGIYSAKTITDSGAGGTGAVMLNRYSLGLSLPSDGDYAYSIFAKKGTRKMCRITVGNLNGVPDAVVNFNLDTGEIVSSSGTSFNSELIESYVNGWYKLSVTLTISNKRDVHFVRFQMLKDDGSDFLDLDGTNTMHFFGAQVEPLSYASSYIPNYGIFAGVTRSQDIGGSTGDISSEFDSRQGTLFFEGSFSDFSSANRVGLNNSVTTFQDRISIATDSTRIVVYYEAGDVGASFPVNVSDIYANVKIAVKWSSGSVVCYTNGTESFDKTNIGSFSQNSLNRVTLARADESLPFRGRVKQIRVYNEALSDAEMAQLTTL